jgi:hypothetical protein
MGPKVASLVARAAGARNICVGFADMTRIRRESGAGNANVTRNMFVDVRHRCKCCAHLPRARDVTFGPLCLPREDQRKMENILEANSAVI